MRNAIIIAKITDLLYGPALPSGNWSPYQCNLYPLSLQIVSNLGKYSAVKTTNLFYSACHHLYPGVWSLQQILSFGQSQLYVTNWVVTTNHPN